MGRQFTISNMGLKLVKAYEGYRPVDRMLVSGQRVIGYGHRILDEDTTFLSKAEAEEILKADLAPFEDMINENVHAPLTQSQFDALCSFAFNIGPKAFMKSDTLRALNNGRPLDAANGFDIWRKSEIEGQTYVVDALMRRRTAEKALFLRPEGRTLRAPRVDLPPIYDDSVAQLTTEDGLPVLSSEDNIGMVGTVPYESSATHKRRRTDGPSGILSLSDVYEDEIEDVEADSMPMDEILIEKVPDNIQDVEEKLPSSLIAVEKEKLKDRLNALIEDVKLDQKGIDTAEWEDSLITSKETESQAVDNVIEFKGSDNVENTSDNVESISDAKPIEISKEDDLETELNKSVPARSVDSASKYIALDDEAALDYSNSKSTLPYWIMILFGSLLFGASIAAYLKGAKTLLGVNGSLIVMCGILIGGMMLFGALYYAFKQRNT